jgi:hypothetical protein
MATDALLPGHEIVEPGMFDLASGSMSNEALAVLAAAPRLRRAGVDVPTGFDEPGASHELYEQLSRQLGDRAHSRHHAMMRRVLSYATTARAVTGER